MPVEQCNSAKTHVRDQIVLGIAEREGDRQATPAPLVRTWDHQPHRPVLSKVGALGSGWNIETEAGRPRGELPFETCCV